MEADRGGEQVRASFSRESVRIFGAMSQDELQIKIVESTNSETFQEFLEEIRRDRPRLFMVLDNASYHKSKAVREYVESTGGDVELEFLPPYTPQLNPCRDRVEGPEEEACRQVLPVARRAESGDNRNP